MRSICGFIPTEQMPTWWIFVFRLAYKIPSSTLVLDLMSRLFSFLNVYLINFCDIATVLCTPVLGAIAVCLFPLWPPEVRLGVYYLSIAAACFVGVIIALCIGELLLLAQEHIHYCSQSTDIFSDYVVCFEVVFFASFWGSCNVG